MLVDEIANRTVGPAVTDRDWLRDLCMGNHDRLSADPRRGRRENTVRTSQFESLHVDKKRADGPSIKRLKGRLFSRQSIAASTERFELTAAKISR